MMGLTVAKRDDLYLAAEAIGLFRRARPDGARRTRSIPQPHIVVDTSVLIDGRVGEIVGLGIPLWNARRAALRARRAPAHRRFVRRAPPQPRPARARHPRAHAEGIADAGADRRRRRARGEGGRREARRARPGAQPHDPHERLQPEQGRRAAGHPRAQHQLARERRQAGRAAGRAAARARDPGGQGGRARASASSTTAR